MDLSTANGRRQAFVDLWFHDHGFFRFLWTNRADVGGGLIRRNQPSPRQIRRLAEEGFRTVVNLRGASDSGYYLLEKEACESAGIELVDFRSYSRQTPLPSFIHETKALFDRIEYPAVMHCKSGADRVGLMAVLYKHFRLGLPISEGLDQLSLRFGHIRAAKTGILDHFFRSYLQYSREHPISFLEWVDTVYDPKQLGKSFHAKWWGVLLGEWILDRE